MSHIKTHSFKKNTETLHKQLNMTFRNTIGRQILIIIRGGNKERNRRRTGILTMNTKTPLFYLLFTAYITFTTGNHIIHREKLTRNRISYPIVIDFKKILNTRRGEPFIRPFLSHLGNLIPRKISRDTIFMNAMFRQNQITQIRITNHTRVRTFNRRNHKTLLFLFTDKL